MTAEVLVDALPYFDVGFDEPGVRETVKCQNILFVYIFSMLKNKILHEFSF